MRLLATLAAAAALAVAGCGDDNDNDGGGSSRDNGADSSGGSGDCLTAQEVQEEIDKIAGGFESSDEEVEAKQQDIRDIRAREC